MIHHTYFILLSPNPSLVTCFCLRYGRLPDIKEQPKIADLSTFMSGPGCMVKAMNHSSEAWWFIHYIYLFHAEVWKARRADVKVFQ